MASLNVDVDYFGHPKTSRLVGLLGRGAEVLPLKLWCYCGKYHAEDGALAGYDAQEIESIVGWWGNRGAAVAALLRVKFLKREKNGYSVVGWREHQGHIHALKLRAKHAADVRWASLGNAPGMPKGGSKHCPIQASHPTNFKNGSGGRNGKTGSERMKEELRGGP